MRKHTRLSACINSISRSGVEEPGNEARTYSSNVPGFFSLVCLILSPCGLGMRLRLILTGVHGESHVARVFFFFPTGLGSMHLLYPGQREMATSLQLCTRDRNTF